MTDFEYDIKEKKRIARGAQARRCGAKSKKCTLPSDYLSPAQKKGLNGTVTTYNLSRPMEYKYFKLMPKDLQKEYLSKLRCSWGIPLQPIARMMGCAPETVRSTLIGCGLPTRALPAMNAEKKARWLNWLNGGNWSDDVEPIIESNIVSLDDHINDHINDRINDQINDRINEAPTPAYATAGSALTGGDIDLKGTAQEILDTLAAVLTVMGDAPLTVRVTFDKAVSE